MINKVAMPSIRFEINDRRRETCEVEKKQKGTSTPYTMMIKQNRGKLEKKCTATRNLFVEERSKEKVYIKQSTYIFFNCFDFFNIYIII